jgi:hypothetical protein
MLIWLRPSPVPTGRDASSDLVSSRQQPATARPSDRDPVAGSAAGTSDRLPPGQVSHIVFGAGDQGDRPATVTMDVGPAQSPSAATRAAGGLATRLASAVSLQLTNVSVTAAVEDVARQAGFALRFAPGTADLATRLISVSFQDLPASDALDWIVLNVHARWSVDGQVVVIAR